MNQWGTVAKALGGDNVNVTSIINSTNVDAHDYEPTTSDIAKLQKAQVIIVNGAGYDAWAVKAAQTANAIIVNAAEIGGVNDGENPHVWFSADVRKAVAQAITEAYEQADAAKKNDLDKMNDQWAAEENNVESKIAEVKQKTDGLAYAATESVASYLAEDMGLADATPSGYARATANESEPTPTDIKQFTDALKAGENQTVGGQHARGKRADRQNHGRCEIRGSAHGRTDRANAGTIRFPDGVDGRARRRVLPSHLMRICVKPIRKSIKKGRFH